MQFFLEKTMIFDVAIVFLLLAVIFQQKKLEKLIIEEAKKERVHSNENIHHYLNDRLFDVQQRRYSIQPRVK